MPVKAFLGDRIDLETTYIIKKFLNLLGSGFINFCSPKIFNDFSVNYTFNTPLEELSKSDFCLLVDVNLRMELPLINSRLRSAAVKNMLPVFVVGYYSNFNYFAKHVTLSNLTILSIIEGSH